MTPLIGDTSSENHGGRKQNSGCQGLREGDGEHCLTGAESQFSKMRSSGDGMHELVDVLDTSQLYTSKMKTVYFMLRVFYHN